MIILADADDNELAANIQECMIRGGWRQFSHEMLTVDDLAKRVADIPPAAVFFVVGMSLERLAMAIVCLRSLCSNPAIAVSHGGSVRQIVRLMRVGATDIIDIDAGFDAQLHAIVDQTLASQRASGGEASSFPELRRSEKRVALLLLSELSENEIAQKLGLSYFTVRNHVKEIYRKCHVHSRAQLMSTYGKGATTNSPRPSAIASRATSQCS